MQSFCLTLHFFRKARLFLSTALRFVAMLYNVVTPGSVFMIIVIPCTYLRRKICKLNFLIVRILTKFDYNFLANGSLLLMFSTESISERPPKCSTFISAINLFFDMAYIMNLDNCPTATIVHPRKRYSENGGKSRSNGNKCSSDNRANSKGQHE